MWAEVIGEALKVQNGTCISAGVEGPVEDTGRQPVRNFEISLPFERRRPHEPGSRE